VERSVKNARVVATAGVMCWVLLSAAAARADPTVITDPNDSMGLDISRVTLAADVPPPVWTIRTFRSWTITKIWDRGYFNVELDTVAGALPEYRATIRSNGRRMLATLYHLRHDGKSMAIARLKAHKVDARSVAVRIPLSKLNFGPDRSVYKWDVVTSFTSAKCSGGVCFDRAPDSGTARQPLPA
jgi:hypothetical protein